MAGTIDARLDELGITLPEPPAAAGAYTQVLRVGNLLYISGQVPFRNGEITYVGKVGRDFSLEEGQEAARACALNIVAQVKRALDGDLDRVARIVKLGGFVNSTPDYTDHPKVINGASNLMGDIFGEKGQHTRFAVGAGSLPLGVAVEVEAIVEVA
ncbi:RidA family protein [Marivibrio halodurans]|uniref:RidA family protein n=1 Tax=Marivibrio halodurans TaxID=2039722 RepID=A0A8J7V1K4_9PROT|nr:RidA family protein [Marivibrio halodurans]MBP5857881.1 RidA family protein [Marivibrio halodurans]